MRLRASSADLFLICPYSLTERPALGIGETSEAAERGTRVHKAIETYISTGNIPTFEAGDDDDRMLFYTAKNLWDNKLLPYFPTPDTEIEMKADIEGEIQLTGHADVVQFGEDFVAILDWKTGFVERQHRGQMLAYGLLAAEHYKKERAIVSIAHLRSGKLITREYSRAELKEYADKLIEQSIFRGEYTAGEHCGFCANRLDCIARRNLVKAAVADISETGADVKALVESGRLDSVFEAAKMLERSISTFLSAVKEHVANTGGALETDRSVYVLETVERKSINTEKATPIVKQLFTPEEIQGFLKIDKTALEKTAMDKAERGEKTAAKKEILEILEKAGALEVSTYQKLSKKEK